MAKKRSKGFNTFLKVLEYGGGLLGYSGEQIAEGLKDRAKERKS